MAAIVTKQTESEALTMDGATSLLLCWIKDAPMRRGALIRIVVTVLVPCLGLAAVVLAAGFSEIPADIAPANLASITSPSEVAGPRAYIPALRVLGEQTSNVGSWIEVQNVGSESVVVALTYWGHAEECASPSQGSVSSDMLVPGASWHWTTADLPEWVQSAKVEAYTDLPANGGEPTSVPLAVAIGRSAPSPAEGAIHPLFTSYVAIPPSGLGIPGDVAQYEVVVPGIHADFEGHNSWLNIQNAGDSCADVVLEFRELDTGSGESAECSRTTMTCEISGLAPGEALAYDAASCVEPGFLGSVWISSAQPLAVVADTLTSGRVADSLVAAPANGMGSNSVPDRTNAYGAVSFGQQNGWETALFVHNLSPADQAKVKVYFVNSSGDTVKTVVNWICPLSSRVFRLSEIDGLPAEPLQFWVESQPWQPPGNPIVDPVDLVAAVRDTHYTDPSRSQLSHQLGYNLRSGESISGTDTIALPRLTREFSDPTLPITTSFTSRVFILNWSPLLGDSEVALDLLGEGCVLTTITRTLTAGQVVAIDLAGAASLPTGWQGSGLIRFTQATQTGEIPLVALVVDQSDQPAPGAGAAYEGVPLLGSSGFADPPTCPMEETPVPPTATPTALPMATKTATPTSTEPSAATPTPSLTPSATTTYTVYLPLVVIGRSCPPDPSPIPTPPFPIPATPPPTSRCVEAATPTPTSVMAK